MNPDKRNPKEEKPTPKMLTAFAREYIKSYLDAVDEKSPEHVPPIAQQAPYHIEISLLPNGCYSMILESAPEMRIKASFRGWDDLQDLVIKGADFFLGFYPHEMKTLADWNKRGRRDGIRDIRVLGESKLGKAAGRLSTVIDEISRMAATNPWLAEKANEQIQMLRDVEEKLRRGFAPVDAIAVLQELKNYRPTYEKMVIEFPDKGLMERIMEGVEELISLQNRMDAVESRMFEVERVSSLKTDDKEIPDIKERMKEIEIHLEKVSNILQMLNTKVEKYFSKSAEAGKQASLEESLKDMTERVASFAKFMGEIELRYESSGGIEGEIKRLREDMDKALKRVKSLEKHFVNIARSFEEE